MKKRIFLDLEICNKCKQCVVDCSYFYHPQNNGIARLWEEATFSQICRQCENAVCVAACPAEALEKKENGILVRNTYLCSGCKSCILACPFGTINPQALPFLTSSCDLCENLAEPVCLKTCPYGAVKFGDFIENSAENIYLVGDHLAVHVLPWKKQLVKKEKVKA